MLKRLFFALALLAAIPALAHDWMPGGAHIGGGYDKTLTVTDATNAAPIVVTTSVAHQKSTGEAVTIAGVTGNTAANGTWIITSVTDTTFSLDGSTGDGAYSSGGTVVNPDNSDGQGADLLSTGTLRIRGATSDLLFEDTAETAQLVLRGHASAAAKQWIETIGTTHDVGLYLKNPDTTGELLLDDLTDGWQIILGASIEAAIKSTGLELQDPLADAYVSDTLTIGSGSDLSAPPAIGGTTPAAGAFSTLSSSGLASLSSLSLTTDLTDGHISNSLTIGSGSTMTAPPAIGGTTPNTGDFTTLDSTGDFTAGGSVKSSDEMWASSGSLWAGVNDSTNGVARAYGGSTGTAGALRLYLGATYDGTIDYWNLGATGDEFRLQTNGGTVAIGADGDKVTIDDVAFTLGVVQSVTISGGAITVTKSNVRVDTQGGASTDYLTTINGGETGMILMLRATNDAHTVILDHAASNIRVGGKADFQLNNLHDCAFLYYNDGAGKWCAIGVDAG